MKRILFITSVIVLMIVACKPAYIRQGIKDVEQLQNSVIDIDNRLRLMDTTDIKIKYELYVETIAQMKKIDDDFFDPDEWSAMILYGHIRKPLRTFLQNVKSYYAELEYSKNQLENLKYDLKNKHVSQEKFQEFYNKESQAVQNFSTLFEINYNGVTSQIAAFDTLYPKMVKVIQNHGNKTRE